MILGRVKGTHTLTQKPVPHPAAPLAPVSLIVWLGNSGAVIAYSSGGTSDPS